MIRSQLRYGSALGLLLFAANVAAAEPFAVSASPGGNGLQAEQLAQPAPSPSSLRLPLLGCLGSTLKGDTLQAIKLCSVALDLNPKEHDAYKLRGYAYLTDHHFERAQADFRAALELKPDDDQDRAGLAQSLSGQGLFGEAVTHYRRAVALAPHKAPYWSALCWARAGTGRQLKQALSECNRALTLQPEAAAALNSRGLVFLRMKNYSRAISDYDAALTVGPRQASARFGRGLARLHSGQIQEAVADIVEARRNDPDIDSLFRLLGVLTPECASGMSGTACPSGFPLPKLRPLFPNSRVATATKGNAP